jgi:hypothetical protein
MRDTEDRPTDEIVLRIWDDGRTPWAVRPVSAGEYAAAMDNWRDTGRMNRWFGLDRQGRPLVVKWVSLKDTYDAVLQVWEISGKGE